MLLICARAGDLAAGSYATLWTAAARWAGAGWPEPGGRSGTGHKPPADFNLQNNRGFAFTRLSDLSPHCLLETKLEYKPAALLRKKIRLVF